MQQFQNSYYAKKKTVNNQQLPSAQVLNHNAGLPSVLAGIMILGGLGKKPKIPVVPHLPPNGILNITTDHLIKGAGFGQVGVLTSMGFQPTHG